MNADTITITILPDGTIKTETDKISGANHQSAENFLKECFRLAGGESTLQFKRPMSLREGAHHHDHAHEHQH